MGRANESAAEFDVIRAGLTLLKEEIIIRTRRGMEKAAPYVEQAATATTTYQDQTGATRASTLAYVTDASEYPPVEAEQSKANALLLREDLVDMGYPPPPAPDEIILDVIASTDYAFYLNVRYGGQSEFLNSALFRNVGRTLDYISSEVGTIFR